VSNDSNPNPDADMPSHLRFQGIAARSYQFYLEDLKRGSSSGITDDFGSAADLLGDFDEEKEVPRFEAEAIDEPAEEILTERAIAVASLFFFNCQAYLQVLLDCCRSGELGEDLQKESKNIAAEALTESTKELAVITAYLTALEQIDSEKSPAWFKAFLRSVLMSVDDLVEGPPIPAFLRMHASKDPTLICRKVASNVCTRIGCGQIGDPVWNGIDKYLKKSSDFRHEAVVAALT
jgi:hypothetical protein